MTSLIQPAQVASVTAAAAAATTTTTSSSLSNIRRERFLAFFKDFKDGKLPSVAPLLPSQLVGQGPPSTEKPKPLLSTVPETPPAPPLIITEPLPEPLPPTSSVPLLKFQTDPNFIPPAPATTTAPPLVRFVQDTYIVPIPAIMPSLVQFTRDPKLFPSSSARGRSVALQDDDDDEHIPITPRGGVDVANLALQTKTQNAKRLEQLLRNAATTKTTATPGKVVSSTSTVVLPSKSLSGTTSSFVRSLGQQPQPPRFLREFKHDVNKCPLPVATTSRVGHQTATAGSGSIRTGAPPVELHASKRALQQKITNVARLKGLLVSSPVTPGLKMFGVDPHMLPKVSPLPKRPHEFKHDVEKFPVKVKSGTTATNRSTVASPSSLASSPLTPASFNAKAVILSTLHVLQIKHQTTVRLRQMLNSTVVASDELSPRLVAFKNDPSCIPVL